MRNSIINCHSERSEEFAFCRIAVRAELSKLVDDKV